MNFDLLRDGHQAAMVAARHHRHVVTATVAAATATVATHTASHHLHLSPRRFVAGGGMLIGVSMVRGAVRLLPVDAPTRVFLTGTLGSMPVKWRDLPSFARERPTPSEFVQ